MVMLNYMSSKGKLYLGFIIGYTIGTGAGTIISGGNVFGLWSFSLGLVGAMLGYFAASKLSPNK